MIIETMKKIKFLIATVILAVMGVMVACHENIVDRTMTGQTIMDSIYFYARLNKDASSSEILSTVTNVGDTITYYGRKNSDGTTINIQTIECTTSEGVSNLFDFDEEGRLVSVVNNIGVQIEFEWQTTTSTVIKAYSHQDNLFVSTLVDFSENVDSMQYQYELVNKKKVINPRTEDLMLEIVKYDVNSIYQPSPKHQHQYDPDNFPSSQEISLWIYQCETSYDAKNYLLLRNATDGSFVGKLTEYERIHKGLYEYQLPLSSYPSSATNEELCANIDKALRNLSNAVSGALVDSYPIIVALNSAAFATGYGMIPAIVTDAIILYLNLCSFQISLFLENGGSSELMRNLASEWYYKEYIVSDLEIIPVGYTHSTTVMGTPYRIAPTDKDVFLGLEMSGEPVINSFILDPSNPAEGVGYTATADFYCVPENSTITIDIVGTDGYTDSITKSISGSGSAVLYVPGAKSGVYDLCTVTINMPFGETLTMQASLVFGN